MSRALSIDCRAEMYRMGEASGMERMLVTLPQTLHDQIFGEHYSKCLSQTSWVSEAGFYILLTEEGERRPTIFIAIARWIVGVFNQ